MEKEKSYILFLRRKSKPDEPYYTVEITPEFEILQRHGKYNKEQEEVVSVDAFLKKFVEVKGNGKKEGCRKMTGSVICAAQMGRRIPCTGITFSAERIESIRKNTG